MIGDELTDLRPEGAGMFTKAHSYRTYDWEGFTALVDRLLDGYNLTEEINGR
jgi:hypothetical protein